MAKNRPLLLALTVTLGAIAARCGDPGQSNTLSSCLAGAVSCDGRWIVTCDPATLVFVRTRECAVGTTCLDGGCALTGLADVSAGDARAPDAAATDTAPADTRDAGHAEVFDTAAADDAAAEDTAEADAAAAEDTAEVSDPAGDTTPGDATPEDAADAAPPTDVLDAADTAPADVAAPFAPGPLVYQRVTNVVAVDDLRRVRWAADGTHALIVGTAGKLLRYDVASRGLTLLGSLGLEVNDLAVGPGGDGFLLVGTDSAGGELWHVRADPFELVATVPLPAGTPVAIDRERGKASPRYAIGSRGARDSVGYLNVWSEASGLSPVLGFTSAGGLTGVMWGDPTLMGGADFVIAAEGVNGTGSHSWVVGAAEVVGNGWSGGFGNAGRAAWRPGPGGYGVVVGTSSNHLLVFDGTWHNSHWPGPNGNTPQDVAWRADGRRALVIGRVNGPTPIHATVIEIRAGTASGWAETYVDQSIPSFADAPWFGSASSMYLLAADWRPGACAEGLIVGTDSGTSWSPSYGYAIRFYDSTDLACTP